MTAAGEADVNGTDVIKQALQLLNSSESKAAQRLRALWETTLAKKEAKEKAALASAAPTATGKPHTRVRKHSRATPKETRGSSVGPIWFPLLY